MTPYKIDQNDSIKAVNASAKVDRSNVDENASANPATTKPKVLIFCFDGTGDGPSPNNKNKNIALSNISKLHLMFGGDFRDGGESYYSMQDQRSLYYSGVGTTGCLLHKLLEEGLALEDFEKIIDRALGHLNDYYTPGTKIFVTGFSRGAAIARAFCSRIATTTKYDFSEVEVECLFVFDTVASIGLPDLSTENRPSSSVIFENKKVSPIVKRAIHCVSMDDTRKAFQPTLMNDEPKVTEVWFAGGHGDVGGGWVQDGLSDITLQFVLDHLKEYEESAGLHILSPSEIKYDKINEDSKDGIDIIEKDIDIVPCPHEHTHGEQWGFGWWLLYDHRRVVVISDDKIIDKRPVVHHTVAKRIEKRPHYRPPGLRKKRHWLLQENGETREMHGLIDYLKSVMTGSKRNISSRSISSISPSVTKKLTTQDEVAVSPDLKESTSPHLNADATAAENPCLQLALLLVSPFIPQVEPALQDAAAASNHHRVNDNNNAISSSVTKKKSTTQDKTTTVLDKELNESTFVRVKPAATAA